MQVSCHQGYSTPYRGRNLVSCQADELEQDCPCADLMANSRITLRTKVYMTILVEVSARVHTAKMCCTYREAHILVSMPWFPRSQSY